jgi:uncharacterized protein (DUF1778 family)
MSPDDKALLERAAALEGRSVSDFVVSTGHAAATEAIRRHEVIALSPRDSAACVEALMQPPAPNEQLRATLRRHQALIGE